MSTRPLDGGNKTYSIMKIGLQSAWFNVVLDVDVHYHGEIMPLVDLFVYILHFTVERYRQNKSRPIE